MARFTLHSAWGVGGLLALAGVALVGLGGGRLLPVRAGPGGADRPAPGGSGRSGRLTAAITVAVLGAAAVAEGHAIAGRTVVLWAVVAGLHVAAAAILVAALLLRLGPVPVGPGRPFARLGGVAPLPGAAVATAVTGLALAGRETGSLPAVLHTAYGQIVALKALLSVAVLLVVGAVDDHPTGPRAGRRGVTARLPESAAALVLVSALVTAVLVAQTPARDAVPRPASGSAVAGAVDLEYQLTPARVGANDVHIYVLDATGAPLAAPAASADLRWAGAGGDPLAITLHPAGPGHFLEYGVEIPFPGTWTLDVGVDLPGAGPRTFTRTLTVH